LDDRLKAEPAVGHRSIVDQLEGHDDAWPFLLPVNNKQFPTYRKIIRLPVDLSTIRRKLADTT